MKDFKVEQLVQNNKSREFFGSFLIQNNIAFDSRIKLCEDVYVNLLAFEKARRVVCINYPAYFYYTIGFVYLHLG